MHQQPELAAPWTLSPAFQIVVWHKTSAWSDAVTPGSSQQSVICIARVNSCLGYVSGCCKGLICVGDQYQLHCLYADPTVTETLAPSPVACSPLLSPTSAPSPLPTSAANTLTHSTANTVLVSILKLTNRSVIPTYRYRGNATKVIPHSMNTQVLCGSKLRLCPRSCRNFCCLPFIGTRRTTW